ncbi:hypothetical protein V8C37DRAFT_394219 [Trichoderma ceciliae]
MEATVINVLSAMGFFVMPGKASYCLSKFAVTQLSRFIAVKNYSGPLVSQISKDTLERAGGCEVWLTTKEAAFGFGDILAIC